MEVVAIGLPIFFQALSFVIFYLVMRRLLYKPLTEFMNKRRQEIEDNIADAKKGREEAKELKRTYEKSIAASKREAREIIDEANRRGDDIISKNRKEAQEQAEGIIKKAKEEINLEKEKAFAELRTEVGRLSIMVAEKVIVANLDEKAQENVINSYIDQVGDVS